MFAPAPTFPLDGFWRFWRAFTRLVLREATLAPAPSQPTKPLPQFAIDLATVDIDELIAEHSEAAYRVALSITRDRDLAQDVTQDALIKAWQKLPDFRGDSPLRNWILRITHNTAISTLRRRREDVRDPALLPEQPTGVATERQATGRLLLDDFENALDELDELSRSIVVLREIEGFSYDEIVNLLDVRLPTVKTRLLRARRHLAVALAGWKP